MKTLPLNKTRLLAFEENVKYILIFLFSFFLSNVNLFGLLTPFAVAFTIALPFGFSITAFAGATVGYMLFGIFPENLVYIIALIGTVAMKSTVFQIHKIRSNPVFLSIFSTILLSISLIMKNVILERGTVDLIFCLCESILGGAFTFFSFSAFRVVSSGRKIFESANIEKTSILIVACTGLLALCRISFFSLNLGRIAIVLLLLTVAFRKRSADVSVIGLIFMSVLTLYSTSFAISGGLFAVAALIAGCFAHFGKITEVAFFMLIYTLGIFITGTSPSAIQGALDMLFAATVFLVVPQRYLEKFSASAKVYTTFACEENKRTSTKLLFASKTLNEIKQSVNAVSEKLNDKAVTDVSKIYNRAAEDVCRKCGLKLFCWETNYNQTLDSLYKLTPVLEKNSKITKDDLSAFLHNGCARSDKIVDSINGYYNEYLYSKNATRKIMNAKQVATEQLEGIADMLSEISEEICEASFINQKLSNVVYGVLAELGEAPKEVYCIIDKYDRMRLEVYKESPVITDLKILTEHLSDIIERPLSYPSIVTAQNTIKITFFEQAKYTLDFAVGQLNCKNQKVSGDCYEYFTDSRGFAHLILSDGMGNGGRAAVDSIMTCNFILKLLKAGFGFDAALKLINSALLVKAGDESLATLDIGCIDLYTGDTKFLKAGATVSFVTRNKKTRIIGNDSLPIGILQGIDYNKSELKLQDGDLIVMVTDGAISLSPEDLCDEISLISELPVKEIVTKITNIAKRRNGEKEDDITVLASRIKKV